MPSTTHCPHHPKTNDVVSDYYKKGLGLPEVQTEAARSLGVHEAIKRLGACQDDLTSVLGALASRLGPLLLPGTDANEAAVVPMPVCSPLARDIHIEADRIHSNTLQLRELLDRLDA